MGEAECVEKAFFICQRAKHFIECKRLLQYRHSSFLFCDNICLGGVTGVV